MLRSKPKLTYVGLTIVMSNASRFDTLRLLSANGGAMFDNHCMRPEFNSMQCDVRLMDEKEPLLPNTKCILILGEAAMHKFLPETLGNTLNEMRGSLFHYKTIPTICSYLPQECVDFKSYEASFNPLAKNYTGDSEVSYGDEEDDGDAKRYGKTKRANYTFWLRSDVRKVKQILSGIQLPKPVACQYKIYPPSDEVIDILTKTKGQFLYYDLESDMEEQNLQCFSFSFDNITIYCVPILDYNYKWAYSSVHLIMRALAIAFRDNTVVAWNGATFDYFVMAWKYKIPIVKAYDPMIAMHRCFPDIEKSLGHATSYWTYEKFHKDEDSQGYRTHQQMMERLQYCGKDTYCMALCHKAIDKYAKTIPGLSSSIAAAMRCIRPYLTSTLQGIKVNETKVADMIKENDRLMLQYNRMIELLIGENSMQEIRGGKKVSMFAGSSKQCARYLYGMMNYPVTIKSKDTGEPSTGKIALYKLALQHDNPVITLINIYRTTKKETGRLQFLPWIKTQDETSSNTQEQTNSAEQEEHETALDS